MLAAVSNQDNPVAVLKTKLCCTKDNKRGKSSHFDSPPPDPCTICVDCKVSIAGKNFNPSWGLFNGSIGTVKEIVFATDANPNHGDFPLYVVVEFQCYCGPAWDVNRPKVRLRSSRVCLFDLKKIVIEGYS
jgi:hypothetical protein